MFEKAIEKIIINKVKKIQREHAEELHREIVANAPINTGRYASSITLGDTVIKDGVITTKVFSDLKVENEGWTNVPLGALLEFGTGFYGRASNNYSHGFSYRLTPWVYYSEELGRFVKSEGMIARPHFYTSLQKIAPRYKKALEEEFK